MDQKHSTSFRPRSDNGGHPVLRPQKFDGPAQKVGGLYTRNDSIFRALIYFLTAGFSKPPMCGNRDLALTNNFTKNIQSAF